jgi:pSer/pThr/pTyr-binding forkhead associated (FHA) protein
VSGAHCRLTEALGEMILEDLGSTNGTYVNGQRIERPIVVRRSDVVTLGSKTRMPWPDSWSHASGASPAPSVPSPSAETPATAGSRVITVGYDPGNDVVLGFPTVSGHHARLILRNNEIWLEDLHSTNGTAIGSPHNRIQRARITAEDIVYFGSLPIPAARLLAIPNPGLRHDGRIEKLSPNSI